VFLDVVEVVVLEILEVSEAAEVLEILEVSEAAEVSEILEVSEAAAVTVTGGTTGVADATGVVEAATLSEPN
jgi:Ethanolamine utilization protein EutJ (predicted chaperonin)